MKLQNKQYLVQQLSFYGAYHSNLINQIIHFIFVPILLITAISLLSFIPFFNQNIFTDFPAKYSLDCFPVNNVLFIWFCLQYPISYFFIDVIAAISWLPLGAFIWYSGTCIASNFSFSTILLIHAMSWILQFIGHGVFEGRKPALLDSFYQSVVLAPLFVWFEFVLFPLGYSIPIKHATETAIKQRQKVMSTKCQ